MCNKPGCGGECNPAGDGKCLCFPELTELIDRPIGYSYSKDNLEIKLNDNKVVQIRDAGFGVLIKLDENAKPCGLVVIQH